MNLRSVARMRLLHQALADALLRTDQGSRKR